MSFSEKLKMADGVAIQLGPETEVAVAETCLHQISKDVTAQYKEVPEGMHVMECMDCGEVFTGQTDNG